MITKTHLTDLLEELRLVEYDAAQVKDFPGYAALLDAMLNNIGDANPHLRDMLIYRTFCEFTTRGLLDSEQWRIILARALDQEHLFYCIGAQESDSVFTRSFSALLLPLALYQNDQRPWLSADQITSIGETVISYINQEKDFRGYVPDKGWAHAPAHIADAIAALATTKRIISDHLTQSLFDSCLALIINPGEVFVAKEGDRIASAVAALIESSTLDPQYVITKLNDIQDIANSWAPDNFPISFNRHINYTNFLMTLYFQLQGVSVGSEILSTITELLSGS